MNVEKTNIKLLIIIALIVTTVLSATYAYLNLQSTAATEATDAGCLVVDYTGQIVTSDNLTSTTEENYNKGAHATVTLKKNANCEIYTEATIHLHTNTTNTAPLNKTAALKYKLLSGSTIVSSGVINNSADTNDVPTDFSIDLATVDLTTTSTTYDIYIWLDSSVSNGEFHDKTYSGYIYATSEQTSTITS